MSQKEVVIWEAGQGWPAALFQLGQGRFSVAISSDYAETCRLASQSPYAVALWEVNLSNWEDRARRLTEFLNSRPSSGVVIAAQGLAVSIRDLFREFGALLILEDRLAGLHLVRILDRQRLFERRSTPNWREQVTTTLPWLEIDPPTRY